MDFDGGGKNLLAERRRALVIGQGLQEQLNCLTDIGKSLLDGLSLRLASLQFRAPGVTSVLVPFDYDTDLARHQPSFYRDLDSGDGLPGRREASSASGVPDSWRQRIAPTNREWSGKGASRSVTVQGAGPWLG